MYTGKLVLSQVFEHLPMHTFRRCVRRYAGHHKIKSFSCLDQFLLYHMGIRGGVSRNTLADANKARDWRIYADFAQSLIHIARRLYVDEDFGVELDNTVYALDASTIDLSLSVFPWAHFLRTKAAVKLHTLLDLRGNIPTFIHISDGKLHDVNALDLLIPELGAFYVMDRGYLDFQRLFELQQAKAFFVIRARSNTRMRRVYSAPVDKQTGLRCDQTVVLTGVHTPGYYPDKLRRIKYYDAANDMTLILLTNHFALPALTVTELYRCRWQVELFFKWIKQHLRIKAFFGTSENAVKTQIWIAVSVYVLVAIIKKRLNIPASLYTILQILSLTVFERTPIDQVLSEADHNSEAIESDNQLNLFE
ncbi:MAG: IS4 family transposase [Gammaproteobacteria bacterium]|nr:IS4 family transposase [Gammaproteobacteria bacterium]NIR92016.1 IS4 family transposase [Gammaproteobacteria bacterium]NIX04672.1 IS4 family transposase [Gammaproteobacteria bacterium]